jgi:hypothetical protein
MLHFNIYEIVLNEIIKTYLGYDCARASLCGQKQAASAGFLGKARWIFFYRKSVGFLDLGAHLPSGAQCSRTVLQGRAWWLWPSRHLDE